MATCTKYPIERNAVYCGEVMVSLGLAEGVQGKKFVECCVNSFRFLQNNLRESFDSLKFILYAKLHILRESTWILLTLFRRICAKNRFSDSRRISNPDVAWICHNRTAGFTFWGEQERLLVIAHLKWSWGELLIARLPLVKQYCKIMKSFHRAFQERELSCKFQTAKPSEGEVKYG